MKFFTAKRFGDNKALFIILEGIAYTMVLNIYSPFVQMFAKRMGAGDYDIALINSLPPLVAIFILIPCSILIERINRKKRTTSLLIFINSLFYALIAFVPFIPDRMKVILYIILIGLMNWPGSLYITTWQSFFADTFSGSDANRVYSLRSKYSAFFGLLAALITGLVLTEIPHNDGERLLIYQLFYFICFLVTLLQLFFLSRVKQDQSVLNSREKADTAPFRLSSFKEIFHNRGFIVFCICTFVFHISWQMGWPLFFIYNAEYAKLNEFQLSLISVVGGISSFIAYTVCSKLIERKGSKFVILIGVIGLALNPLFFTSLHGFAVIILVNTLAGFSGAAFNYTLFCSLLESLPENKKTIYISFFNTFINISGFTAPLVGIWLYRMTSIYKAMLIIGLLRFLTASFFVIRWRISLKSERIGNNNSLEV